MEIKVPGRLLGNTLNKKLVHCPEALKFSPRQQARAGDKQAKYLKQGHCSLIHLMPSTSHKFLLCFYVRTVL